MPPVPMSALVPAVEAYANIAVAAVLRSGWLPSDLAEVVSRRLSDDHLPPLTSLLAAVASRHPTERVAAAWRTDLAGVGPAGAADPWTISGLARLFELFALFRTLPRLPTLIPPPGTSAGRTATGGIDPKVRSRVRSLLAKAESTDFPEEAEALSAKAQELISRYAIDRLTLAEDSTDGHEVTSARLWIDPPYLRAKAMLIGAVARANRCRTVVTAELGFSTIVGEMADVEAVDLLATSLLAQASSAMHGHGSVVDGYGTSRTRSFRQSFLVSFAIRIGERLMAVTDQATEDFGRTGELVPLLRRQAERVAAAVDAMFPSLSSYGPAVSNHLG
jgi:hypothetical protein